MTLLLFPESLQPDQFRGRNGNILSAVIPVTLEIIEKKSSVLIRWKIRQHLFGQRV